MTEDDHPQAMAEDLGHALQRYLSIVGEMAIGRSLDSAYEPSDYFENGRQAANRHLRAVQAQLATRVTAAATRAAREAGIEVGPDQPANGIDIVRFLPDASADPHRRHEERSILDVRAQPAVILEDQLARGAQGIVGQVTRDAGTHPLAGHLLEEAVDTATRAENAKDTSALRDVIGMYVAAARMSLDPSEQVRKGAAATLLAAETGTVRWMTEATADFLEKATEAYAQHREDYLPDEVLADDIDSGGARLYAQHKQAQYTAQARELDERKSGLRPVPVVGAAKARTGAQMPDGAPVAGCISNAPTELNTTDLRAPAAATDSGVNRATPPSPMSTARLAAIGLPAVQVKKLSAAMPYTTYSDHSESHGMVVNTTVDVGIPTRAQTVELARQIRTN